MNHPDEIGRAIRRGVGLRRHRPRPAPAHALQAHRPHQALDRAARDRFALPPQLFHTFGGPYPWSFSSQMR